MSSCKAKQNQPLTFSMCMITKAMHAVVIESELYISYVNVMALHSAGTASLNYWWMNESVTEFLRFFLPSFLPPPIAV